MRADGTEDNIHGETGGNSSAGKFISHQNPGKEMDVCCQEAAQPQD